MINFIAGVIVGFFVATYGVSGVAAALDKCINLVKSVEVNTK